MLDEKPAQTTSSPHLCRHCGNRGLLKILTKHTENVRPPKGDIVSHAWIVASCPSCSNVSVLHLAGSDYQVAILTESGTQEELETVLAKIVYPASRPHPKGLPTKVSSALNAAERLRPIDSNAYAVLVGRVIELMCADRDANGSRLFDKIKDLQIKGEIPSKLVEVAQGLRKLRNAGAHSDLGDLTESEAALLADLCRALLEFVYTAPYLVSVAEKQAANRGSSSQSKITQGKISAFVASQYGLKIDELKSRLNAKQVVFPRQVAMYMCRKLTDLSFPEIGKHFNDKHHSTVMHSVEKIEKLRAIDKDFDQSMDEMFRQLLSP